MSNKDSSSKAPAVPGPGNLLSSVPPPSELPNYILNSVPATTRTAPETTTSQFAPAIPSSLAENFHPAANTDPVPSSSTTTSPNASDFGKLSLHPEPAMKALTPLTQLATTTGTSLFGWVKGAADVSGVLLQKIGEKAMSSMDTLVTTLDPQMKDYIRSGGDVEILIASDKEDKVRPIREAFQLVFGRATLMPVAMDPNQSQTAAQPVGFPAALSACQDRVLQVRSSNGVGNKLPVIALENFLVEIYPEHWFDVGMMVLDEPEEEIYLETFTQMTPIPSSVAVALASETPVDYVHAGTGFSVTVGQLMATNLQVAHTEWHERYTGTRRSEFIYLAAKTLATRYKEVMGEKERERAVVDNQNVPVVDQPGSQERKD